MIVLYSWATGNGRKASIMLEETGLPYRVHPMPLATKVQKSEWYLAINPNGRIPAIVDPDGPGGVPVTLFESGAILIYLAEKAGMLLPTAEPARSRTLQWLMFQAANFGPMAMQVHWLVRLRDKGEPAPNLEVYIEETARLYGIMDRRLAEAEHLAGDYSIADIATYPWVHRHGMQGIDLAALPHVRRWYEAVGRRPAVKRGMNVPPRDDGL